MSVGSEFNRGDGALRAQGAFHGHREPSSRLREPFRRRMHDYPVTEQTLRAVRELMMTAQNPGDYARRRAAFLGLVGDGGLDSGFIARVLRYFAVDAPHLPFEDRDTLVYAVIDRVNDDEALVLFLLSMSERADSVRPIIDRITSSERAFPILTKLLTAPWLDAFRHILAAKLIETARHRQGALRVWVRADPDAFFQPEIFELLLRGSQEALSGVCKEILINGPEDKRARLIAQLENEGTESALRLLVLGLPFGGRRCEPALIAAIASFNHGLAVAALRDVVHCGNLQQEHTDDAIRAMRALNSMDNEESRDFIDEVVNGRSALLPTFRRELRKGAAALRADEESS